MEVCVQYVHLYCIIDSFVLPICFLTRSKYSNFYLKKKVYRNYNYTLKLTKLFLVNLKTYIMFRTKAFKRVWQVLEQS